MSPGGTATEVTGAAADAGPLAGTGPKDAAVHSYLRGSGLLLGGRGVAILLNLAVQVLTVRYLTKTDFGAFAYALGVASIGSSAVLLGLGKTIPRFIPLYQERNDYPRVFGTMALAAGTVWGLGLSLMVLLFGVREFLAGTLVPDPLSLSLLLVLIALAPINATDHLLQNVVAIFARPSAIFMRRHVLGPGFKLLAILAVMVVAGNVHLLAYAYVLGGVVGIWLYLEVLRREWRRQGLLEHVSLRRITVPARELFAFGLPLTTAELRVLLPGAGALLLLGYYHSAAAVAEYRAVYPISRLNLVVFQAFGFLFMPVAARMFARADTAGLNDLYWRTSAWIVVFTFPVFALTTSLAVPVTVLLFGSAYATAGIVLAVLAVGDFMNAALGFNADTLRAYGKVRYEVLSNAGLALTFVGLSPVLIPRYGALGAAATASASLLAYNLLAHAGLWRSGTGIRLPDRRFLRVSAAAATTFLVITAVQWLVAPPLWAGVGVAGAASLALLRVTRHQLNPTESFPEVLKIPLLRRLLA